MHVFDWLELFFFIALLLLLVPFVGIYIAAVATGSKNFLTPVFGRIEKRIYRLCGIDPEMEMHWKEYAKALGIFALLSICFLFLIQIIQFVLPLNPQKFSSVSWDLALNTAISFTTNTNWQSYAGETTLSYFTQMLGIGVQNFLSAGTGLCVFFSFVRGISRKSALSIGNFWTDLTRSVLYILVPLSFILAFILVAQGVVQTLSPYVEVSTMEGSSQEIPLGPVASQVAIKQIGSNGGGFFRVNSAHPFENPTPISNFFETLAIILIPAASTYAYGLLIGSKKEGWMIFSVMFTLWIIGFAISMYSETLINPVFGMHSYWEGKEMRFGVLGSILWSTLTTATSNGSVNAMMSSLSPLAGGVAMFNIMLSEIVFGGVGVGISGMILFILLAMFLTGLMSGRTPQYQYKKIEKKEMRWVIVAIVIPSASILLGSGISCVLTLALQGLDVGGPHGLSEILYAFSSAAGNNGSAFAGIQSNTIYYNLLLSLIMLLGRAAIILPCLAISGSLVQKSYLAPSPDAFRSDSFLFAILLIGTIVLVGALTFFSVLCLGPIVEHFVMKNGLTF